MNTLTVPIILGTGRNGRYSEKVAAFVCQQAIDFGFSSRTVDVRDFATPVTVPAREQNAISKKWKTIINRSVALIFVVPEYNHGYPGELKILLDRAFAEYKDKIFGLCIVSSGIFGGARVAENLLPVLIYLQMIPAVPVVYFGNVQKLFSNDGIILDSRFFNKQLQKLFSSIAEKTHKE